MADLSALAVIVGPDWAAAHDDEWAVRQSPVTRTAGVAVDHEQVTAPDVVIARTPHPIFESTGSDRVLGPAPRAHAPVHVSGLGPLPEDEAGLRRQLTRAVRGQGLRAVAGHLRRARESAELLSAGLRRLGRRDAQAPELLRRLDVLDAGLVQLRAERAAVQDNLQPYIVAQAQRMLHASAARVQSLREQYFDDSGAARAGPLHELRRAAQQLLRARKDALSAPEGTNRAEAERRYATLHAQLSEQHPLLQTYALQSPQSTELDDLARDTPQNARVLMHRAPEDPIEDMLDQVQASIEHMQDELHHDPSVVWRLPAVVHATLLQHGVPEQGMVASHANDIVREQQRDDSLYRASVSVLAMGLGIAAALPSGGTSLAVAGAVTTAVDGYQLFLSLQAYSFESSASGTDLDLHRALLDSRPGVGPVLLDAVGTTVGALGVGIAARKTAFAQLEAHRGPLGEMARGLKARLGGDRAEALVDALGAAEAELLYRDIGPEVWAQLGAVPQGQVTASTRALGPEGLRAWQAELGPQSLGTVLAHVPAGAWPHLLSTTLNPQDALRITRTFSTQVIGVLGPQIKGRGLARLAEGLAGTQLRAHGEAVLIDGQLSLQGHALLRALDSGQLAQMRQRLDVLVQKSPLVAKLGPLRPKDLRLVERLAEQAARGDALDKDALSGLKKRSGQSKALVRRIVDALGGTAKNPGTRAHALMQAAPELRTGLKTLTGSPRISQAMKDKALDYVARALASDKVTFDRPHLNDLLLSGVHDVERIDDALDSRLLELEYALDVVDRGKAADGSTLFLGAKAGERVQLRPGGPWVEMPVPLPGEKGTLQDIDVLFLSPVGHVQALEVKRSVQTLWHALDKTGGRYLRKFVRWREQGAKTGQTREVGVAIRHRDGDWLTRRLASAEGTPSQALSDAAINVYE